MDYRVVRGLYNEGITVKSIDNELYFIRNNGSYVNNSNISYILNWGPITVEDEKLYDYYVVNITPQDSLLKYDITVNLVSKFKGSINCISFNPFLVDDSKEGNISIHELSGLQLDYPNGLNYNENISLSFSFTLSFDKMCETILIPCVTRVGYHNGSFIQTINFKFDNCSVTL